MKKLFLPFAIFILAFFPLLYVKAEGPIKILLVPGHDNEIWGTQYWNLKEAAMNLAVASRIFNILKSDKRFEVHITRNKDGYTKEFANYFANHQEKIKHFRDTAKEKMKKEIESGSFLEKENVPHNTVGENVSIILYGINKWANENNMDAVIHIHFNDHPRANNWTVGKYKGFAIYMPEEQMSNSEESALLARSIFGQLNKKYVTSNYEKELGGLIPDQKLIALGANNTLVSTVRSVLVEYGYIYRFGNSANRPGHYDTMANLTAIGIKNYFFGK